MKTFLKQIKDSQNNIQYKIIKTKIIDKDFQYKKN